MTIVVLEGGSWLRCVLGVVLVLSFFLVLSGWVVFILRIALYVCLSWDNLHCWVNGLVLVVSLTALGVRARQ